MNSNNRRSNIAKILGKFSKEIKKETLKALGIFWQIIWKTEFYPLTKETLNQLK